MPALKFLDGRVRRGAEIPCPRKRVAEAPQRELQRTHGFAGPALSQGRARQGRGKGHEITWSRG
jgi:hypothetical protein